MKIFFSTLLFCASFYVQSQDFEYFGAIKLNDTSLISYKVVMHVANGIVEGYSITDLGGDHETKSLLLGSYDEDVKQLFFTEYSIEYTKSPITQNDFCFVHFSSNTFKLGKTKSLTGAFEGKFSDNTKCIDGEIILTLKEKVEKKMARVTKKINKTKRLSDSVKQRVNPLKLLDSLNMNILRKNQILSVFSKSKYGELIIYDGGKEDGDVISVTVDDQKVLDKYVLINKKRKISLRIKDTKSVIKINAISNGTIAPNTASIKLIIDGKELDVLSNLKEGEHAQIDLVALKK